MRLPWPFGRARRSASSDDGGGTAATASGGAIAPVERPPGDAWRRLPPLAETMGPPPLVAPNRPFAAGLAAGEPPAPILAPLAHGRSLEAPRGLVVGVARPTPARPGPALPAPVQRAPLGLRRSAAVDADDGDQSVDGPEPAPRPATIGSAGSAPAAVPIPRPAVPDVAPRPTAKLLTRAPEPPRAAALVGLVGQPHAPGATRARPKPSEPEAVPPPVQRAPGEPASARPDGPRLTIGQARRLGLGAPILGRPIESGATALTSVGRSAPDSPGRQAQPATPPAPAGVQRAPVEPLDLPLATGAVPSTAGNDAQAATRPVPPAAGGLAGETPPVAAVPVRASAPASHAMPRPLRSAGPIVSAQPLRTGVQRAPLTLPQRAANDAAASDRALPAAVTPAAAGPVKIHRGHDAAQLSEALDARSFTHGGEIFMPDRHGPLDAGRGKALLAHELTHVSQQRRFGSSLPAEHTSRGRALEAEAVAAERAPEMTLVSPTPGASRPAADPVERAAAVPDPILPESSTNGRGPGLATAPQRAPAIGGEARRPTAPGGGQGHSEQELEVLAHQLYQRIGRHLRRELLVDRERSGFALDLP